MTRKAVAMAGVLVLAPWIVAWHPLQSSVGPVEEGNEALLAGDGQAALQRYGEAPQEVKADPRLQYDRGLAQLAAGSLDEAQVELQAATHAIDAEVRYRAWFALGILRYQQEDWAAAVDAFKAALRLRPADDSVRLNYELAWLRLHPPCSSLEDAQEDNDSAEAAKLLTGPIEEPLRACPGDEDWFALDLPAGAALFVNLKQLDDPAPMLLEIRDPSGATLQQARGRTEGLAVDQRLVATGGRHLVRVVVEDPEAQPIYELGVDVVAPCPQGEDQLEENDTPEQAREVAKGEQKGLRLCPGDQDWFAVPLRAEEPLAATLSFPAGRGRLRVDLLGLDGEVLAAGTANDDRSTAALPGGLPEGGRVLVRIEGERAGVDNRYDLTLADEPPEEDKKDQEQEQDEEEEQDKEQEQDQDKEEEQDKEQDQDQDKEEEQDKEKEQEQPQPQPPPETQAMEQALEALRAEDRDVQLEKLLRSLPPQQVEKDW